MKVAKVFGSVIALSGLMVGQVSATPLVGQNTNVSGVQQQSVYSHQQQVQQQSNHQSSTSISRSGDSTSTAVGGNASALGGSASAQTGSSYAGGSSVRTGNTNVNIREANQFPELPVAPIGYNSFGSGVSCAAASVYGNAFVRETGYNATEFGAVVGFVAPIAKDEDSDNCSRMAELLRKRQELELRYLEQQVTQMQQEGF